MNSAERRMKILLLLQSKTKSITVNYLAQYFEVSRRTIFRDLRMLQDMEVPVTYEENEGYGIMRGYSIPPLMFNPKEIATIMVGLNFAKSQLDSQLVEDAKAVELKVRNVVPPEIRNLMDVLSTKVIVDPYISKAEKLTSSGDWYTIATAISQNHAIEFLYDNKRRTLNPLIVVYYSDHWNVIGYYPESDELRSFKIEKINSLEIAVNTEIKTPSNYTTEELIYRDNQSAQKVVLRVEKSIWREFRSSCPAIVLSANDIGGIHHVELSFSNLDFLSIWLLRFENKVTIISPDEMIEQRISILNDMLTQSRKRT